MSAIFLHISGFTFSSLNCNYILHRLKKKKSARSKHNICPSNDSFEILSNQIYLAA